MKIRHLILPTLLVASTLVVAAAGGYIKYGILRPLGIERDESIVAMPFVMLTDDALRFMVDMKSKEQPDPVRPATEATEPAGASEATFPEEGSTDPIQIATEPSAPVTAPMVTEPVYVELDESWFDDVLFIGDSRTAGLKNYYRLGKADYFTNIGMNIYNVFVQMSSDTNMDPILLEDLLQKKSYGKIYIGIGLNECNFEHEYIKAGFAQLIELIQTHQPDAKIILQSIMKVSEGLAKSDHYFDHANLDAINDILKSFCDGENIFYIDYNAMVTDEKGYLRQELTHDGIHLYGTGYKEWALWIKDISGTLGIP